MSVNLCRLRVVTDMETHHSSIEEYTEESLEELYRVLDAVTRGRPNTGMSFSFRAEEGGGKTFIPAHRIRYITVLKVDPSE